MEICYFRVVQLFMGKRYYFSLVIDTARIGDV